jgi:hypothetical protein
MSAVFGVGCKREDDDFCLVKCSHRGAKFAAASEPRRSQQSTGKLSKNGGLLGETRAIICFQPVEDRSFGGVDA